MRKTKFVAYLLASTIYLTGCGNNAQNESKKISVDDLLCTEIIYTEEEVLNNLDKIYDEYTNNQENFDLMGRDDVLEAAFLWHNIADKEVDEKEVIKELNMLLECYIVNYDMTEEKYKETFKTILKTYGPGIEIYYPLAECMHLYSCPLPHEEVSGALICNNLEKYRYIKRAPNYEDMIAYACIKNDNKSIRVPYFRLFNSGIEMSILLDELNNVYYFGRVPVYNIDEEWEFYFSNLKSTLKNEESLFDYYYELAVYIHQLSCTCEHKINEYNACVCDNMSLTKTREE